MTLPTGYSATNLLYSYVQYGSLATAGTLSLSPSSGSAATITGTTGISSGAFGATLAANALFYVNIQSQGWVQTTGTSGINITIWAVVSSQLVSIGKFTLRSEQINGNVGYFNAGDFMTLA